MMDRRTFLKAAFGGVGLTAAGPQLVAARPIRPPVFKAPVALVKTDDPNMKEIVDLVEANGKILTEIQVINIENKINTLVPVFSLQL